MKRICISSPFGSGNSVLKMLTMSEKTIDPTGTCHSAWTKNKTINNDQIDVTHHYDLSVIQEIFYPDISVWVHINKKNILDLCQRIVILEFLYAKDTNDYIFCWTRSKHNAIAGPDWPSFSTVITDYPTFCLDELCQVAYNRCVLWTQPNKDFTFQIDSDELFGSAPPVTINQWLASIDCQFDMEFFETWKNKRQQLLQNYQHLFTWRPDDIAYMIELTPDPTMGVW
jgi:hypothetical protein